MFNSCLFLYNSIQLAMKEAEIQKPGANLTTCPGAEHLSKGTEGQENSRLCDLETEPVKLIRNSGGKVAEIAVQFCLIHRTEMFCNGSGWFYSRYTLVEQETFCHLGNCFVLQTQCISLFCCFSYSGNSWARSCVEME